MSHDNHGGTKKIWIVFWLLLALTSIEVALGIYKPFSYEILKWTFIILTLVKAYYIVAYFMHVKHERTNFAWTLALPTFILIPYLLFILLTEASDLIV
jgi:heme/copper-type cytochrome/quinol oxidase subunit 4